MNLVSHRSSSSHGPGVKPNTIVLVLLLASAGCRSSGSGDAASSTGSPSAMQQAPAPEPAKVELPSGDPGDAVAIAKGGAFHCVLQRAGTVACWGSNTEGQLGQDHRDEIANAVLVRGLDDAVAISASGGAGCAARRSGSVVCWGDPSMGELGNGKTDSPLGLVEVVGVRDVTGLHGGSFASCATTASGRAWCWGTSSKLSPLFNPPDDRKLGPHPLDLEGIGTLYLGHDRSVAYLDDGNVLVWGDSKAPAPLPDVVEIRSIPELECVVRSSGEVSCTTDGKRERVLESLHGARQLSLPTWGRPNDVIAGILPDGTVAGEYLEGNGTPTFTKARDVVALPPENSFHVHGIRRDGRVFVWESPIGAKHDHVAREIVLPDPSTVEPATLYVDALDSPAPESSLPSWCSVEIRTDYPERETWEAAAKTIGTRDPESLCDGTLAEVINSDSSECTVGGPWFVLVEGDELDVALVVQLDGEHVGRIADLVSGDWELEGWKVRSSSPIDAWLHVREGDTHGHVVLTQLANGLFLRTDVTIDMARASSERKLDVPTVEIADGMVDVAACGGRLRAPLPPGARELEQK